MQKILRTTSILFLMLAALIAIPTQAQAVQTLSVIAEDSFDYTGNVVGNDGGSGFAGAWSYGSLSSNYRVSTPGLTYPGLTTSGGFLNGCSVLNGQICAVNRNIEETNSGQIYLQVIANFGAQSNGFGTPNIRFYNSSGALTGGLGSNGGTYGTKISILDTGLTAKADGTSSAGILDSQSLIILKIDYTARVTSLWVNPNLSTFSYFAPPNPDGIFNELAPQIRTMMFISRFSYSTFDELKILRVSGTTAAEDAAAAAATASAKAAADEKARRAAEAARAARISAARKTLIIELEKNLTINPQEMVEAEIPIKNTESLKSAYRDLMEIKNSLDHPLSDADKTNVKFKIFMKYATIEQITGAETFRTYPREMVYFGLLSESTPQKSRILSLLRRLPLENRDSMVKVNAFFAAEVAAVNARRDSLSARLAK